MIIVILAIVLIDALFIPAGGGWALVPLGLIGLVWFLKRLNHKTWFALALACILASVVIYMFSKFTTPLGNVMAKLADWAFYFIFFGVISLIKPRFNRS